jgi:hypothetical protein
MNKGHLPRSTATSAPDSRSFSGKILALWPPKSERDELLLEIYEQLQEKHADTNPARRVEGLSGAPDGDGASR